MTTAHEHPRWAASLLALGALAFVGLGCKNNATSPTDAPTSIPVSVPGPPSFVYTVPGTSQEITVVNDGSFPGVDELTRQLSTVRPSHLAGIQTLHSSNVADEISINVYNRLAASDSMEWQTIVGGSASNASRSFQSLYRDFLTKSGNALVDGAVKALRLADITTGAKFFFMVALFADRATHQFMLYQAAPGLEPTFNLRPLPYTLPNSHLIFGGYQFTQDRVRAPINITGIEGTRIPQPMPLPTLFYNQVMLPEFR